MENFTPISAAIGGAILGLSAIMFMGLNGRVAGISGVIGGLLSGPKSEIDWRLSFVAGLILAPFVMAMMGYQLGDITPPRNYLWLIVAGLLVGFGTRLGGGCTSGHGVCGTARLSVRSITATVTYVVVAIVTLLFTSQFIGG